MTLGPAAIGGRYDADSRCQSLPPSPACRIVGIRAGATAAAGPDVPFDGDRVGPRPADKRRERSGRMWRPVLGAGAPGPVTDALSVRRHRCARHRPAG